MEPRVTYPDLQIHPGVRNAVLVDMLSRVSFAEIGKKKYPSGAILHFDADIDAFSELTGGPHTFNHAVLSPQYQRNADDSYTDVGAKPAVDVFDGEKWLRSCGAVTNLLKYSEQFDGVAWRTQGSAAVTPNAGLNPNGQMTADLLTVPPAYVGIQQAFNVVAGSSYTFSIWIKKISGDNFSGRIELAQTGILNNKATSLNATAEWQLVNVTTTAISSGVAIAYVYPHYVAGGGGTFLLWGAQLTATSYPMPYVPTTDTIVTMPASNATTTNGMWFSLPDGSPLWKALTGEPLTLATRVRMGVGSGDFTYNEKRPAISSSETVWYLQYFGNFVGTNRSCVAYDGTTLARIDGTWPRNSIINRVTQVSADGTQFRVGYMIEGTHTTIQWSSWAPFDGSFDPSTLYRLMLGYNNAYPMWFNKITAWKEQVSDSRILEAMA